LQEGGYMATNREILYIRNVSGNDLTIADLPKLPAMLPNQVLDILKYHRRQDALESSNLIQALRLGLCSAAFIQDGSKTNITYSNARETLSYASRQQAANTPDDDSDLQAISEKDQANGYAGVDSSGNITLLGTKDVTEIGITIDGQGAAVQAGTLKGYKVMETGGTILGWKIIADQSGSIIFDVKKGTFAAYPTAASVVAAAPPTLTTARTASSTSLTGWTVAFSAGDVFQFDVSSASTVTKVSLILKVRRS
jgi:microcompartment protein CcmL/EutN